METITEDIILQIKNKDEDAFRQLFYAYRPKLFYIALKELRDKHDAEDCIQEVFLRILKQIKEYDHSKSSFSTWVIMILKNCMNDIKKQRTINGEKYLIDSLTVYSRGVKNNFDLEVLLSEIEQVIGEEKYKVLTLKRGFNLTFLEISEELSIHPSKAKTLYYEGYKEATEYIRGKEQNINGRK